MIANERSFLIEKFFKKKKQKQVENEKGPLGCSMIWKGMLEKVGVT